MSAVQFIKRHELELTRPSWNDHDYSQLPNPSYVTEYKRGDYVVNMAKNKHFVKNAKQHFVKNAKQHFVKNAKQHCMEILQVCQMHHCLDEKILAS